VTGFHRPASDLALGRWSGPRWRVVHLSVEDLTTAGSESRWRRGARLLEAIEHRSFRRMDRVYIVNRQVAARYRRRFPDVAERFEFIPNWADPTIFRLLDDDERRSTSLDLRASLGMPERAPIVLFAGRLEGQKDPLLLARAFGRLRAMIPDAQLVVAGDGSLREPMRAELARHGALDAAHIAGIVSRERLAQLMNASDALAITSAFETGPTVGLEALACGLPVVTAPVGEVARLVAESGAGAATADRSPDALARALADLVRSPGSRSAAALDAARPFLADRVLGPLYEENRRLASRLGRPARSRPPILGDGAPG
jgi:glycosyltransferase involved in cell wall biosynthesis